MSRTPFSQPVKPPKTRLSKTVSELPSRDALLLRLREIRPDLASRYHILSLGLFGSYGRGTPTRRSDVDILVSFTEAPSLFTFVRLKGELERCLGRRVDLVMREALRPAIGRRILAEVLEA